MGRSSTGVISTGQCLRLYISSIATHINNGSNFMVGSVSYDNGASIGVSYTKKNNIFIVTLSYTKTIEGEKKDIKYDIRIDTVPSNLGKGNIYYFLCPFTSKRCKILYMGYGSLYFKSREAYTHKIYYNSQLSSHNDRHNDTYWRLEKKLENLYKQHPKKTYQGKVTKPQQRIKRLEMKHKFHDEMRWLILPKALMKMGIRF